MTKDKKLTKTQENELKLKQKQENIRTNYQNSLKNLENKKNKNIISNLKFLRGKILADYKKTKEMLKLQERTMPPSEYYNKQQRLSLSTRLKLLKENYKAKKISEEEYDTQRNKIKNDLKLMKLKVRETQSKEAEQRNLRKAQENELKQKQKIINSDYEKRLEILEKKKNDKTISDLKYSRGKILADYKKTKETLKAQEKMMPPSEYFNRQETLNISTRLKLLNENYKAKTISKSEYNIQRNKLGNKLKLVRLKVKQAQSREAKQKNLNKIYESLKKSKNIVAERQKRYNNLAAKRANLLGVSLEKAKKIISTERKLNSVQKNIEESESKLKRQLGKDYKKRKFIEKAKGKIGLKTREEFKNLEQLRKEEKKLQQDLKKEMAITQSRKKGKTTIDEIRAELEQLSKKREKLNTYLNNNKTSSIPKTYSKNCTCRNNKTLRKRGIIIGRQRNGISE